MARIKLNLRSLSTPEKTARAQQSGSGQDRERRRTAHIGTSGLMPQAAMPK